MDEKITWKKKNLFCEDIKITALHINHMFAFSTYSYRNYPHYLTENYVNFDNAFEVSLSVCSFSVVVSFFNSF